MKYSWNNMAFSLCRILKTHEIIIILLSKSSHLWICTTAICANSMDWMLGQSGWKE